MPGRKGAKMIQRLSVSKKFHSVKELVFSLFEKKPTITKEEAEKIVQKEYPTASFMGTSDRSGHFTWYKHRWNRMKLENANFNIKESHPKEEVQNESVSHESKKGSTRSSTAVDKETVGKDRSGRKSGRVPIQPKKRSVVIKARKAPIQRKGDPKDTGQPTENPEVHD